MPCAWHQVTVLVFGAEMSISIKLKRAAHVRTSSTTRSNCQASRAPCQATSLDQELAFVQSLPGPQE